MEPVKTSSSNTTKKWLIGCGIGCGAILLIVILLIMGGFFFIKNIAEDFKDSAALMDTLKEEYGEIEEYCPDSDGSIKQERLKAFLAAREAMLPAREELERSIRFLQDRGGREEGGEEERRSVFKKVTTGFGLIPRISDFHRARVQALMDVDMGIGEYYYIYTITYFSWLGKPLLDGPDFQIREDDQGYRFREWEDEETQEIRQDMTIRWLHRIILPMLKNQYGKLIEEDKSRIHSPWQRALEAEIKAMEENRYRMVWEDGLPDVLKKSLEPFRHQLETSYSPLTNSLEVALERRQ
ncbi:MAG: hypothetical protein OEZ45_12060 [Candidatus Aminicenantes bacterium]|nr:hypothetical protein [Candidatus Aminicenantes bacterium]